MIDRSRIERDIRTLAQWTATPGEGTTRLAFSAEEKGARAYLAAEMEALGLVVATDGAGNLSGRLEGTERGAPAVLFGSHIDSVRNGGDYDGPAGIVAALETVRSFVEEGRRFRHPLEIVVLTEEEGGRWGAGLQGSRAMVRGLSDEELALVDGEGLSKAEVFRSFGLDPARIGEALRKPGTVRAFLELHIEQGPLLEAEGVAVGLVTAIVGIREFVVTLRGRADHAGTTPLALRQDALRGAARMVEAVHDAACSRGETAVATVGSLTVRPGAYNVVPAEVTFTVDMRDTSTAVLDEVEAAVRASLARVCDDLSLQGEWKELMRVAPVAADETVVGALREAAGKLGLPTLSMTSGAGHDAMIMAGLAPMGMVFAPSRGGKSHSPEEFTAVDDLVSAVAVYAEAVALLAQEVS